MSELSDLGELKKLVDLKYRQQQESFARLIAQENTLRAALERLDTQLSDSRNDKDTEIRAIGADVLWQAWIGRKQRALNIQLAQVLAVKERHIAQVRDAFGRVTVTDALHEAATQKRVKEMALIQLDRAILLSKN